jgi:hypothetical protein
MVRVMMNHIMMPLIVLTIIFSLLYGQPLLEVVFDGYPDLFAAIMDHQIY